MIYINIEGINKEDKRRRKEHGRMYSGIADGKRCVFLETDKIEGEELEERDKKALLKLGELLESQAQSNTEEIEEVEELDAFDIGRLYMYIMIKAKTDTNFLNWWLSNNFTISEYGYDFRDEYITIRTGTGTSKS